MEMATLVWGCWNDSQQDADESGAWLRMLPQTERCVQLATCVYVNYMPEYAYV